MAAINFLFRSTKDKANLHLRLLYRHIEKDYVFGVNTKFEVSKYYWNKQHKKKSKDIDITNEQTRVNNELNKIENHILNAFNFANLNKISKEWLQNQMDYYYNPPVEIVNEIIPLNLIEYIDYYIKNKENYPSVVLIRKIRVLQKKLVRFQTYRKTPILIKDVNKKFKLEFADYCENQKYSRTTIQRDFAEVKTISLDARTKGIGTSLELDKLSFPRIKSTNIFLTFDEITAIENIEKDKLTESLDNAKDWLIISCFTGQRISDFMRFTADMIRIENGKSLIEFTQKKTGKLMTVPLHPKVIGILAKRNGVFPHAISSQKYNDYIKTVCEIAEITQIVNGSKKIETEPKSGVYRKISKDYRKCDLVSSHIGRRSFSSNFYGTIPTTYLIYVTGHSSEVMFLNYIGKSNKDLALEMTNYF
jgi:integrase